MNAGDWSIQKVLWSDFNIMSSENAESIEMKNTNIFFNNELDKSWIGDDEQIWIRVYECWFQYCVWSLYKHFGCSRPKYWKSMNNRVSHYYLNTVCVSQPQIIIKYLKWGLQYSLNIAEGNIQKVLIKILKKDWKQGCKRYAKGIKMEISIMTAK